MEPEDRYRMLRDDAHWNPIHLTPRSQPSLASQRERRGAWFLRGTIAIAALAVLGVFVTAGLSGVGRHNGAVSPGTTSNPLVGASAEMSCPAALPEPKASGIAGAGARLLPFDPSAALFCVYSPLSGGPRPTLTGAYAISDAKRLASLHDDLDANFGRPAADQACTADLGPTAYLRFAGATGQSIAVAVQIYGCRQASNGTITDDIRVHQNNDALVELSRGAPQLPGFSCPTTWVAPGRGTSSAPVASPKPTPTTTASDIGSDQTMLCRYVQPLGKDHASLTAATWSLDTEAAGAVRSAILSARPLPPDYFAALDCPAMPGRLLRIQLGGDPVVDATVSAGCGAGLITSDGIERVIPDALYIALQRWPAIDLLGSVPPVPSSLPAGSPPLRAQKPVLPDGQPAPLPSSSTPSPAG